MKGIHQNIMNSRQEDMQLYWATSVTNKNQTTLDLLQCAYAAAR
jgi:hypothetical protein